MILYLKYGETSKFLRALAKYRDSLNPQEKLSELVASTKRVHEIISLFDTKKREMRPGTLLTISQILENLQNLLGEEMDAGKTDVLLANVRSLDRVMNYVKKLEQQIEDLGLPLPEWGEVTEKKEDSPKGRVKERDFRLKSSFRNLHPLEESEG